MNRTFRVGFALRLATAAAVRMFCTGAHKFAHRRRNWTILRVGDSAVLSWSQAVAMQPDGILGVLEPGSDPVVPPRTKVVILNAARRHSHAAVTIDDVETGRRAAEHLLERRLENFAFVGSPRVHFSALRRVGFETELRRAGFAVPVPSINAAEIRNRSVRFMRWLETLTFPCGLFCANDGMGLEFIRSTRETGIKVPDQISVIGASNDEMACVESHVTLTSVREDYELVGYRAAALLDELMRGRATKTRRISIPPGEVAARESTQSFGVSDPLVRRALLVIHQSHAESLTVGQLQASLGRVSRRLLEMRFQKALGRSPYQEILHARIETARHLMRSTALTIADVAHHSGFYDAAQLCRHFRRICGTTAGRYRSTRSHPRGIPPEFSRRSGG